ncbi:MAG TPA: hypothetical protein VFI00_21030 [Kribbella sp.]|nr:hypothetical protein [Kribbella sp.]
MRRLQPEEALALWDRFPVDRQPRPIVLMSYAIGPGAIAMVEDKASILHQAAVVSDVELPPGLLESLQPDPAPHWHVDPVRVRSVRRVYPEFRTDRGHRPLPAYRIEFAGVAPRRALDPKFKGSATRSMHALDPEVEATTWWPADLDSSYRGGLRGCPAGVLIDGGRTVRLIVMGSPPEYTDVRVRAVLETQTAVMLVIQHTTYDWVEAVPPSGVGRLVTARLTEPLGARVLLQADGIPVGVLPG